jgi:hypothetical protein
VAEDFDFCGCRKKKILLLYSSTSPHTLPIESAHAVHAARMVHRGGTRALPRPKRGQAGSRHGGQVAVHLKRGRVAVFRQLTTNLPAAVCRPILHITCW